MAVFRVEKNSGYTVMSNHHLRNRALSLKAKGLLSQMLSLPEDWDYTLQGLARINRESIDAIRQAIRELEQAGYIQRSRERDEKGRLRGADYVIFELPQPVPASVSPTLENPTLENPTQENPTLENPMQLNKDGYTAQWPWRCYSIDRKKTYNSPAANILRASRESPLKYLSYQDLDNRMTVRTAQTAKTSHRGSERPAWGRHRVQKDFLSGGSKGDRL